MTSLDQYAQSFADYLLTGDPSGLKEFCCNESSADLLLIYRNGFVKACLDALRSNYPSVVSVTGDDYFAQIGRDYILQSPPRSGSLVGYGETFPDFIDQQFHTHGLGYLADVARLDKAWLEVYLGADGQALLPDDIQACAERGSDVEELIIRMREPTQVITTHHSVGNVWETLKLEGEIRSELTVLEEVQHILLWRIEGAVHSRILPDAESQFMFSLIDGLNLGQASQAAQEADGNFDVSDFFAAALSNQLFERVG